MCDGFACPITRVCVRGAQPVINGARRANFRDGYEFAVREGGVGAAQLSQLLPANLKAEPFYGVLKRRGGGLKDKAEYKREYQRVKARSTYLDVWHCTGFGLASDLSGPAVENIVKLCLVKHEVGDAFVLSVPSVQQAEASEVGFRALQP